MKICSECKHFKPSIWCVAPSNDISLIDGKPKARFANEVRSSDKSLWLAGKVNCGPEGRFFEQKKPRAPWWKFWV